MVKKIISTSKNIFSRQNSSILSAALVIGFSYLGSALLGLIRNRLLAARFFGGLEGHLDVYFAAFVLPDTIFQLLVVGALSAAFIPVYARYLKKGTKQANRLANATLNSILVIMFFFTALLMVFAHPVSLVLARFPAAQSLLMAQLMRLMLISQIFFTVSTFLTGIIQTHRRFLVPALAPIFYNLGIILGILFLTPTMGIFAPAIGVIFGAFLHMVVQIPLSFKLGFRYRLLFAPAHIGVKQIRRLMVPRTLALAAGQMERFAAVYITSLLIPGSLSIFNFARSLYVMPISLFGVSLGQASFPTLSDQANFHSTKFKKTLSSTLLQLLFFALPFSAILLVLRIPVVRLVFGAKNFPWEATLTTAKTLALFTISIAPQAASHILVRAFYAIHNTKTPLLVSLVTILFGLGLSYIFALPLGLGVVGLALALTISNTISFFWLLFALQRHIGKLKIYANSLKILVATLFTASTFWFLMHLLDQFVFDTTRTLPLIGLTSIAALVGMLVYFAFCYLLKVEELSTLYKLTKKLGNWRQILIQTDEILEPSSLEE